MEACAHLCHTYVTELCAGLMISLGCRLDPLAIVDCVLKITLAIVDCVLKIKYNVCACTCTRAFVRAHIHVHAHIIPVMQATHPPSHPNEYFLAHVGVYTRTLTHTFALHIPIDLPTLPTGL